MTDGTKITTFRLLTVAVWFLIALRGWYLFTQANAPRSVEVLWIAVFGVWLVAFSWSRSARDAASDRKRLGRTSESTRA